MDILFWLFLGVLGVFSSTFFLLVTAKRGKFVYLTFDDGPDSATTPKVLDVLKKYGVKATFFVMGEKAEKYPELIKRIASEGHLLGNHSYSHKNYLGIYPPRVVLKEYEKTAETIQRVTGTKPRLARLPQGVTTIYNHLVLKLEGYRLVNWSVSAKDWEDKTTKEDIVKKVLGSTTQGSVILLHDGLDFKEGSQTKVLEALPQIIEGLTQKGLKFSAL